MNIFFALKRSKLFIIIYLEVRLHFSCNYVSCVAGRLHCSILLDSTFSKIRLSCFHVCAVVCSQPMISEGFKLCFCSLYVHIKEYQKDSSCVIVCLHPMISDGFKLCYFTLTSNDIRWFQAVLLYVYIQ